MSRHSPPPAAPPRPTTRIEQQFEVVETSCGFTAGEFRWGVTAGVSIVQDGLSEIEARTLAAALQKAIIGFREFRGMPRVERQLLLRGVFRKEAA